MITGRTKNQSITNYGIFREIKHAVVGRLLSSESRLEKSRKALRLVESHQT
jgi:hypothetical protein